MVGWFSDWNMMFFNVSRLSSEVQNIPTEEFMCFRGGENTNQTSYWNLSQNRVCASWNSNSSLKVKWGPEKMAVWLSVQRILTVDATVILVEDWNVPFTSYPYVSIAHKCCIIAWRSQSYSINIPFISLGPLIHTTIHQGIIYTYIYIYTYHLWLRYIVYYRD